MPALLWRTRVNSHKNARTNPYSRALLVSRVVDDGWTAASSAVAFGISVRTVRKWLARYRAEGPAGLVDRPSRPRDPRTRIRDGWAAADPPSAPLPADRRRDRGTARARPLDRCGRAGTPRSRPAGQARTNAAGAALRAGTTWRSRSSRHQEAAKFDKPGHRVTATRRGQNDGTGWEYVHVCIDDRSRTAYVEVREDETGDSCARFLARAIVWFAAQGVTIRRVMTDNGTGYRSHLFRQAREALGLRHLLTRPYTLDSSLPWRGTAAFRKAAREDATAGRQSRLF
jgi:hypothetical protein